MRKSSTTIALAFTTVVLAAPALAHAEGFRPEGFHFYKDLSGSPPANATYGRVVLDGDITAHSGLDDLVVARDGKEVPSFTRPVPPEPGRSGTRKPEVIYSRSSRGLNVILVKLPNIPEGTQYTSLRLKSTRLYEAGVYLSGGTTPAASNSLGSHNIYRYGGHSVQTIRFQGGANRFFKLAISGTFSKATFRVVSAGFTDKRRVSEFKTKASIKDVRVSRNSDNNASVYYFDNEQRAKLHRLVLEFKDARYERRLRIYEQVKRNKSYNRIAQLRLSRRGAQGEQDGRQVVDLPFPVSGALKLEVLNGDDEPLTLQAFEAYSPREEIVFRLPQEGGQLRIYYGNRYLSPRNYDIRETYDSSAGHVKYTAGAHTKNEKFSYSVLEPPLSSWIIRILFWLGVLGLALPAFKIFTSYAKAMTASRENSADA